MKQQRRRRQNRTHSKTSRQKRKLPLQQQRNGVEVGHDNTVEKCAHIGENDDESDEVSDSQA